MGAPRAQSVRPRRRGGESPRGARTLAGSAGVAELQRSRMLSSAVRVVAEGGYGQMSVSRVAGGAGVSRRTFYELFADREACFLAAFDQAIAEMHALALTAWVEQGAWQQRVRGVLAAVLGFLDEHPGLGSLVIVEALAAGPRVLAHRACLLERLAALLDEGRQESTVRRAPSQLTAEGLVGAVLGVLHARLLDRPPKPLLDMLNPLMGMILAPYLGPARAARELNRPLPETAPPASEMLNPLRGLNMRITYRTITVLASIAAHPDASNRQIADLAGISDQGQISKLLARLQSRGLIQNTTPQQPTGEPNRWRLTPHGRQIHETTHIREDDGESATAGMGEAR
jgi:AcrR family transcriptional regulator/DNA-binding MarR family transcriptional regulator